MRDAIVFSSWSWEMFNVPERIALAIAMRGARVLYCEMPASWLRHKGGSIGELAKGVRGFRPDYWGAKLNVFSPLRKAQWKMVARQVLKEAEAAGLKNPVFVYSHIEFVEPLCEEMRANGLPLIHVCMDYPEPYQYEQIAISDRTLVIPKTVAQKLKARFGEKIATIPQAIHLPFTENGNGAGTIAKAVAVPRADGGAILGYMGPVHGRIRMSLLTEMLRVHPEWHFVCFGGAGKIGVQNASDIKWAPPTELAKYLGAFDVGLMPYDCSDEKNLHCVPLKLFDYFHAGMPVVSTPVLSLREYGDLIYFGETAGELANAVGRALKEDPADPRRQQRKAIAREHSTEALGLRLEELIDVAPRRSA